MKQRAKPTELKAGDDVLVKHTGTKGKLTSYWTNDLFTVTKEEDHCKEEERWKGVWQKHFNG